jgi:hypothetical protein
LYESGYYSLKTFPQRDRVERARLDYFNLQTFLQTDRVVGVGLLEPSRISTDRHD